MPSSQRSRHSRRPGGCVAELGVDGLRLVARGRGPGGVQPEPEVTGGTPVRINLIARCRRLPSQRSAVRAAARELIRSPISRTAFGKDGSPTPRVTTGDRRNALRRPTATYAIASVDEPVPRRLAGRSRTSSRRENASCVARRARAPARPGAVVELRAVESPSRSAPASAPRARQPIGETRRRSDLVRSASVEPLARRRHARATTACRTGTLGERSRAARRRRRDVLDDVYSRSRTSTTDAAAREGCTTASTPRATDPPTST